MKPIFAHCLICLASALPTSAQDAGLYKDIPDPNAAFVRIVAASPTAGRVETHQLSTLESGVSPYVQTPPGAITISVGAVSETLDVGAGAFYSFVLFQDGNAAMVADKLPGSPAQASLSLFNLSDLAKIDLFVPRAGIVALADVPANGAASVALKAPLTLDFVIRSAGLPVASLSQVLLKRRNGVTILLTGQQGNYRAVKVNNRIEN